MGADQPRPGLELAGLEATGHHLFADVFTSVGVLAGLTLATLTGWTILDPLLAGAVAFNILRIGYNLAIESMSAADGSGGIPEIEVRISRSHPRQRRGCAASPRHPHAHRRAADVHRVPSGGAG
jgi:hypothetical protein